VAANTHASRRQQRVAWLLAYPDRWRDAPSHLDDLDAANRLVLLDVVQVMTKAELFSARTDLRERMFSVRVLISEARHRL
jgi:adenosyl cobinamide kinase/adenosyl cobinamide phosphate guanylyltransferase